MSDRPIQPSCRPMSSLLRLRMANTGFTLIESLIVIFIVGILAAIATPSFLSWVRNKEVDDVTVQVVGAFKEAQSEALRKGKGCVVNISAQEVSATTESNTSPIENCLPTGTRDFRTSSPNVRITTTFGGGDDLIFTYKKTTPNDGVVVLTQPEASHQRCIVVSAGLGLIRTGYYQGDPSALNENSGENCSRNR